MRRNGGSHPLATFIAHAAERLLHGLCHEPVGEPRRVTHEPIHPVVRVRQPHGTGQIADVVAPDVVAPKIVQITHGLERCFNDRLVIGVDSKTTMNRSERRNRRARLAPRRSRGEFSHELVEATRVREETLGEPEFGPEEQGALSRRNCQHVRREEVTRLTPLHAITEVDRHGEGWSIGGLEPF